MAGRPYINIWAVAARLLDEDAVTVRTCTGQKAAVELADRVAPAYEWVEVRKYVVKETRALLLEALLRGPGALKDERYQVYCRIPRTSSSLARA